MARRAPVYVAVVLSSRAGGEYIAYVGTPGQGRDEVERRGLAHLRDVTRQISTGDELYANLAQHVRVASMSATRRMYARALADYEATRRYLLRITAEGGDVEN